MIMHKRKKKKKKKKSGDSSGCVCFTNPDVAEGGSVSINLKILFSVQGFSGGCEID